jgi:membrane protein implicated in regulation of membrane protease activity
MILVWVLLTAALLATEATVSTAFYAFFLALGAAAGVIASAAGAPLAVQLITVGAVDLLGLAAVRPNLMRRMGAHGSEVIEGFHSSLVGQQAITVDEVGDEHHPGHALLLGERWLAVSESDKPLPPESKVIVSSVKGTTLVVRSAEGPWW